MQFFPNSLQAWIVILKDIITAAAVIVGGGWAVRKYLFQREGKPRIDLSVGCEFAGTHGRFILASLIAYVENVGQVPQYIEKIEFDLRYLMSNDELADGGPEINHQLFIPHELIVGAFKPGNARERMVLLPGVKLVYRHVCKIPVEATYLLLHARMTYPGFSDYHRADNFIRVPPALT